MSKTPKKAPQKARRKPRAAHTAPPSPDTPKTTPAPLEARTGVADKPRFCGKKGRSGPKKGNKNAMKHGLQSKPRQNRTGLRHGLKAGELPPNCKYIEVRLNKFRRTLEDVLLASKNEVSLTDAAYVQTALRWERHAALSQRWMRLKSEELKPVELLHFSREIARASAERDRAIAMLHLNVKPEPPRLAGYIEATVVEGEQ